MQRINQLTGTVVALQSSVDNLTDVTVNGFDAIAGLARGDNYLVKAEDGELDEGVE